MNLLVTCLGGAPADGIRRGTGGGRRDRHIQGERLRLLPRAGHPAADDRLRPAGFTRRAGGLAARPRHGQLLQDLPRLRRRAAVRQPDPGSDPRQHHAVLADADGRLGGPVVLGERTRRGPARAARLLRRVLGPGRLHHLPRRDLAQAPRSWVEKAYPNVAYFNKADQGRALRRLGGAGAVHHELRAAFRRCAERRTMSDQTPTVVLVHGAFADASSWNGVIELLEARGLTVTAPPNPLRGIAFDSAYIASVLEQIPGPVLVVAHSYGGAVSRMPRPTRRTSSASSTSPRSPPTRARRSARSRRLRRTAS